MNKKGLTCCYECGNSNQVSPYFNIYKKLLKKT